MPHITIVGLGPGHPQQLTRHAWQALTSATTLYARTLRHPTFDGLPENIEIIGFDSIYDQADDFDSVYTTIVSQLLQLAQQHGQITYAVPGHPAVAEATVRMLRQQAPQHGCTLEIIGGLSFLEPALEALGIDALPALYLADALDLATRHHPPFDSDTPTLIAQLYNRTLASDVKLTLMNQYPDDFQVALLHNLSTPTAQVEWLPLYEIDHSPHIAHLTALYLPPLPVQTGGSLAALQQTVAHLRAPEGCPWDREQTHQTLREGLLEEVYEVLNAIDTNDLAALQEELGDLLFHIVMQVQMATESGEFQMPPVIDGINSKLIRRHPHVFGDMQLSGVGQVLQNWDAIKAAEKANQPSRPTSLFDSVPPALPALAQALTYQTRAARQKIDAQTLEEYIAKVSEEISELQAATTEGDRHEELGDLLFAVVNWARWINVDPETALRQANNKFRTRVDFMLAAAAERQLDLKTLPYDDLEALWNEAKHHQKNQPR